GRHRPGRARVGQAGRARSGRRPPSRPLGGRRAAQPGAGAGALRRSGALRRRRGPRGGHRSPRGGRAGALAAVTLGFWQLVVILALGPRRVVRWVRWGQAAGDRLRGRPVQPRPQRGWLRAIELFEHSSQIGWAFLAIGCALAMFALAQPGWPIWKGLAIAIS